MLEAHDGQNQAQKMHLESAAGDAAGNTVETDDGIADVKHSLWERSASTSVVNARHCRMQHGLLNLQTTNNTQTNI